MFKRCAFGITKKSRKRNRFCHGTLCEEEISQKNPKKRNRSFFCHGTFAAALTQPFSSSTHTHRSCGGLISRSSRSMEAEIVRKLSVSSGRLPNSQAGVSFTSGMPGWELAARPLFVERPSSSKRKGVFSLTPENKS